jgi:hypothetical protein
MLPELHDWGGPVAWGFGSGLLPGADFGQAGLDATFVQ